MPTPIQPQQNYSQPNAVIAPQLVLQCSIANGQPLFTIQQLTLQAANVDASGKWSVALPAKPAIGPIQKISFTIDAAGKAQGLPADIESVGPQLVAAQAAVVAVIQEINAIRKVV